MMDGREKTEKLAATRMAIGSDVNFGELCRQFIDHLRKQGAEVLLRHKVTGVDREASGWRITAKNLADGGKREFRAPFVFLGAGGGALPLLQKSGIPEGKGYGGFPSAANGCAAMTRRWPNSITPRCTARPRSARRPCRSPISIPA